MSVVYAWVYNGTGGSVLLAILMHGSFNTMAGFLAPIAAGTAYGQFWWLMAALWCAVAGAVVLVYGPASDLSRRPKQMLAAAGGGFHPRVQ